MSSAIPTIPEFTPDFSGQSKYLPEYGFDSVIFPTNAPLLAEDLNESQQILNDMVGSLVSNLLTDGVVKTHISWHNENGVSVANGDILPIIASGKMLLIKGSVAYNGANIWAKFHKETITADTDVSSFFDGAKNYLTDNIFGAELSRRTKFVFDGLFNNSGVTGDQFAVKILSKGKPEYSRVKVNSEQGDILALAFNGFAGGTADWDTTEDGLERCIETQIDIEDNNKVIATKTTVFNEDYTIITETLSITDGKTYRKVTTFGENDSISTNYTII